MPFISAWQRQYGLRATSGADLLAKLGIFTFGKVFYVDSTTGSNNNSGLQDTATDALATIAAANTLCTASKGDYIVCGPGHAETITAAAGISLTKAGVTLLGLGRGTNRPTIGVGTATTATFKITAANVAVQNFRFRAVTAQSLVKMIDVAEGNFTMEGCWFQGASTATFLVDNFIHLNTTYDDFVIRKCQFFQGTDPDGTDGGANTGAIYIVDSENILIDECEFYGNFETALIHNKTTACKNLWVKDCRGYCALSGSEPFQLVDGATGGAFGGMFLTPAEAAATEATLVGTIGSGFFISPTCTFGNDSVSGGAGGIIVATAS